MLYQHDLSRMYQRNNTSWHQGQACTQVLSSVSDEERYPDAALGVRLTSLPRKTQLSGNSGNTKAMARKWAETTHYITIR